MMNSTNGQHESNELLKQILNVNEETLTLQRLQFKLFEEEVKGLKKQMGGIDKRMGNIEQKVGGIAQKVDSIEHRMIGAEERMSNIEHIILQNAETLRGLRNDFNRGGGPQDV